MAELYQSSQPEDIVLGRQVQNPAPKVNSITGDEETDAYLNSLAPEERQAALDRITAPATGKELVERIRASGSSIRPTLDEFKRINEYNKEQEYFTLEGAGAIMDGFGHMISKAGDALTEGTFEGDFHKEKIMPTIAEGGAQGFMNFYGFVATSSNSDSPIFKLRNILTGNGTIESKYEQYLSALDFEQKMGKVMSGEETLVSDPRLINKNWAEVSSFVIDPTLLAGGVGKVIGVGALASKVLGATKVGLGVQYLAERAALVKNGVIGGTLKWGVGAPVEFLGGAVRNTVDFGVQKAGAGFEAVSGISADTFNSGLRNAGIGTTIADIAGHGIPYGSAISEAYIGAGVARGVGESFSAIGNTMMKQAKYGRGVNSWALEAIEQTPNLSKQAKSILGVLNAVDPMLTYSSAVFEGGMHGAMVGGALGMLGNKAEGMYEGMGAGLALGGIGGGIGKVIGDTTGNTGRMRREIQSKIVMEGLKEVNPDNHFAFASLKHATEVTGGDVDFVNSVIIGIDKFSPDIKLHALTEEQFNVMAIKGGYDPATAKFRENSMLTGNLSLLNSLDRTGKANALSILRDNGFNFAGDRAGFLDALKNKSSYKDVARRFNALSDNHKEVVLKQIEAHADWIKDKKFTKTEVREHYNDLQWAERWTDVIDGFHNDGADPIGIKKAKDTIATTLKNETNKDGSLTRKGELLRDKLRNEGYLDKDGNILETKDMHNFDLTSEQFKNMAGVVLKREMDGRHHMYLNLNEMKKDTFAHELFHSAMRTSVHSREFIDRFTSGLHGKYDKFGKLISAPTIPEGETLKFMERYLRARFGKGGILSPEYVSHLEQIKTALNENKTGVRNNLDAWKLLEHYSEEFGAYYFSEWIRGKNRNYLFRGGELRGLEGLVERVKEGWLDYWQGKFNDVNPQIDFSEAGGGIAGAFVRSGKLGRIRTFDLMMQDFVRATSASNKETGFKPSSLSEDGLASLVKNGGIRGVATIDPKTGKPRLLDTRTGVAENIKAGKAAYNILSTLDPKLRTSVVDGDGNITGRLSRSEFDALVRGGIVEQAWADKHMQLYAIMDGKESNVVSFGYLGKSEQTTDASHPRNYGKDVTYKQRQAIILDVETKIGKDGKFHTLVHTLDKKVIRQRGNNIWLNEECRNLWGGNRSFMEADFFKYLENASKPATDGSRVPSASVLDKGDGLGARRRDFLHQMLGMAKTDADPYVNRPIAEIPQGIRHSVTTFNIDGVDGAFRVDNSQRYQYNHQNAFRDLSHNWSPADSTVEKLPTGRILTHLSGYKFTESENGTTKVVDRKGSVIGTYPSKQQAFNAGNADYNKTYSDANIAEANKRFAKGQQDLSRHFSPPLDNKEIAEARERGSVFEVARVKQFIGDSHLIPQTREEFCLQSLDDLVANPDRFNEAMQRAVDKYTPLKKMYIEVETELRNAQAIAGAKMDTVVRASEKYTSQPVELKSDHSSDLQKSIGYEIQRAITEQDLAEKNVRLIKEKFEKIASVYNSNGDTFMRWVDATHRSKLTHLESAYQRLEEFRKVSRFGDTEYGVAPLNEMVGFMYDDQFQTGKPVSFVAQHGTKNEAFATSRLFDPKQLGSNFAEETSRQGSWFAGSQATALHSNFSKTVLATGEKTAGTRIKMGIKSLIKMENPMVVEWNANYSEGRMATIIREAKQAGHDGVVFKKIKDGTLLEDNNYIVLKEKIEDNILPFESSIAPKPEVKQTSNAQKWVVGEGDYVPKVNVDAIEKNTEFLPRGEGIRNGGELGLHMSPKEEGFGKHSEEDFLGSFIGKVAEENRHLTRDLKVVVDYDKESPRVMYVNLNKSDGTEVGNMVVHISPENEMAKVYHSSVESDFRGRGFGNLLYSEAFERLKSLGIKNVRGEMADREGRPAMIRKSVAGKTSVSSSGLLDTRLTKNRHYSPSEEGGRTYNPEEYFDDFIGKVASKNPNLVSGLKISYKDNGFVGDKSGNLHTRIVEIITEDGRRVGDISGYVSKDGKTIRDVEASISYEHRGQGYGKLLYSEFLERMRNQGINIVHGNVTNREGIPVRIRNEVAGKGNTTLISPPEYKGEGAITASIKNFKTLRQEAGMNTGFSGVPTYTRLKKDAWYSPRNEIPNNEHWIEGIKNGYIKFVEDFSALGIGSNDAMMVGHIPDTAKVGGVEVGGESVADMQGGLLYTVVNGNKLWASNFGKDEGGILKKFINKHLAKSLEGASPEFKKQYPNGVAYVLLTKADSSKIFSAVDGTKGLVRTLDVISRNGLLTPERAKEILLKNASEYSDVSHLKDAPLSEVVKGVLGLINNENKDIGSFPDRAKFADGIIADIVNTGRIKEGKKTIQNNVWKTNPELVKKLEGIIGSKVNGDFNLNNAGEFIGRLFEEEFLRDVPTGHSYGVLKVTAPLTEVRDSGHRGYTGSLEQVSGRHELILFNETHNVTELANKGHSGFNKKQGRNMFGEPIKIADPTITEAMFTKKGKPIIDKKTGEQKRNVIYQGEGSYGSYTGGNIPYQELQAKQFPVLSRHNWKSEKTPNGEIIKSELGYRITETQTGAYKVWNKGNTPTKGLYGTLAEAKLVVDKLELTKR